MTFCRCQDFVIDDCFERHKLQVVDYKSLSITKYDQLVFSFQRRKATDDFVIDSIFCCNILSMTRLIHSRISCLCEIIVDDKKLSLHLISSVDGLRVQEELLSYTCRMPQTVSLVIKLLLRLREGTGISVSSQS